MRATVFNIQKFSLHDGPGIRTVVFFKGCPLKCRWCANPESQNKAPQLIRDMKKCKYCGLCENGNHDTTRCPARALSFEGTDYSVEEIYQKVMEDFDFYTGSGGGVTYSGGEALLYTEFIWQLSKKLREKKVHIAAETTGFSSEKNFVKLCNSVDLLLFDVKHWSDDVHKAQTGVSNVQILGNLRSAVNMGMEVIVRIPVIPKFNHNAYDIEEMGKLLKEIGVKTVNLLPFHQMGESKYTFIGKYYEMQGVPALHKEDMEEWLAIMKKYVENVS